MPNGFDNQFNQFDESADSCEPISFGEGLGDFFGTLVRCTLDNRKETVENAIPATLGVLARGADDYSDLYQDA